jgi:DUF4097 and DUF4098 domain-containing protein YvlB
MRSRSITGPVLLVLIGFIFLVNNIWRDTNLWAMALDYWPILLIVLGVIGLMEVLYHASRGVANPPRPLAGAGVFWIVMLVAFFNWAGNHGNLHFGPWSNGGINVLGTNYSYDVNATGDSKGVSRVVLDNLKGTLSLKGDDGGEVKVSGKKSILAFSKGDADRANEESPLKVERQGDLLIVHADDPKGSKMLSVSADLDIAVPKGLDVEVRGRNGDLTIDDVSGAVSVEAGKGDVRISNVGKDVKVGSNRGNLIRITDTKGKVDLEGPRGGDVQLENIGDEVTIKGEYTGDLEFQRLAKPMRFQSKHTDFRVEAVPGDIKMDSGDLTLTNLIGPVRFTTSSRDVHATDVSGGLELSVEHGDIEVTQTKTPLAKMEIHSGSGDVTLAIPEKAGFDIDGKTGHGEVSNDFGDPLKTEQEGRAATIKGKQGSGPEIKVTTDRGGVTIKKS